MLKVQPRDTFELDHTGTLVVDSLILLDASCINLNPKKNTNSIQAKVMVVGRNCYIYGRGKNGENGSKGAAGSTSLGPCRNGSNGRPGTPGEDGKPGINLSFYLEKIIVNGNLIIDLAGGNGGDGGDGGEGGGGSPGTVHCNGGNGGLGGEAGAGGNGGSGGTITFRGSDHESLRLLLGSQVVVNTLGGSYGYGGIPGGGGSAGLGPRKSGVNGKNGRDALRGRPGTNGVIQFEQQ
ncbi:MAG TPA: collagen-like protein [Chryseosolibacter sp.]|nr:collagen-like protein [Chryseosolibacter sp.]